MGKHTVIGLLAAMLSVLAISQALVQPIRHTYPSPGLQSVNGSDPTGGCTDPTIFHGIGLCSLGNSSLVDGSIPTLPPSLVGVNNWAAGLFTVNRSGRTLFEIGFELSTSIHLIQVELELFNCPEWGIAAPNITVYTWVQFPGLLPSPRAIATCLGGVTTLTSTSCNSITRVLIPLQQIGTAQFYYFDFTFDGAPSVQWVHLAEVRFFDSIPPPTPTTSSVSAPTGITSITPSSGTRQPLATTIHTSTYTSRETPTNPTIVGEQQPLPTAIIAVLAVVIVILTLLVLISIVVIVTMVALMRNKKRKDKVSSAQYEDVQDSTGIEMKENEAYIRHGPIRVEETSPSASSQPEYDYVDHVHVMGDQLQQGEIEIKRNKAYAQVVTTLND